MIVNGRLPPAAVSSRIRRKAARRNSLDRDDSKQFRGIAHDGTEEIRTRFIPLGVLRRTGVDVENDPHGRFDGFGVPPGKQGDYALLLHIVRTLKSTGTGACILPHGVLFRGNAEAAIRKNLIRKGYIQGIIGLPPNLFYGTGITACITACIIVIDKSDSAGRRGIFMVDASSGFIQDGAKNRLRSQDLHKIVDVFNNQIDTPGFGRMVGFDEIEKNEFNLNLPRYIDSGQKEDTQDISAHLVGGIPIADVDALQGYWNVCPTLREHLFEPCSPRPASGRGAGGEGFQRPGYVDLSVDKAEVKTAIYDHSELSKFIDGMKKHFVKLAKKQSAELRCLVAGFNPKQKIDELSESLLNHYDGKPLISHYDVYQHLMDDWAETMQGDAYLIAADGWVAETYRVIEKMKNGKEKDKGWACDLVPKSLIVARYFAREQTAIDELNAKMETLASEQTELEEEHGGEDDAFGSLDKINKAGVAARIKEIKTPANSRWALAPVLPTRTKSPTNSKI